MQRSAHTLKGSANLFCAKRVHDAALELEFQAREKGLEELESDFQRLELEVDALLHVIRDFLEVTAED